MYNTLLSLKSRDGIIEKVYYCLEGNAPLDSVHIPHSDVFFVREAHKVMAKEGDTHKFIRFGQQGVKGAGKSPDTAKDKARKKSYYARHNAQGKPTSKLSAKYWSHKVKW